MFVHSTVFPTISPIHLIMPNKNQITKKAVPAVLESQGSSYVDEHVDSTQGALIPFDDDTISREWGLV